MCCWLARCQLPLQLLARHPDQQDDISSVRDTNGVKKGVCYSRFVKIVWSRLGFSNDKTLTTDKLMVGLMTYILR